MRKQPKVARRMDAIQVPIIPAVAELIEAHPGTISLGQGMVGYGPPPLARERVEALWDDPESHKYQAVAGLPELRSVLAEKVRAENGFAVGREHFLLVTAGSNMAFLQALLAIADPGDEVVLLAPFYFNHEMAVGLADCHPVVVPVGEGFQPDLTALESAISGRTRAVVTVSPNNPTGAVYRRDSLLAINQLCAAHGIYHICDEAYEYFVYGENEHVSAGSFPGAAGHTIVLYSLSKSYGFAGWRIGYGVFPAHLEPALMKIQDTNLICPPVVSQLAALGVLEAGAEYCRGHVQELAAVRALVLAEIAPLVRFCRRPPVAEGAMYVFLELDTEQCGFGLTKELVRRFGVAPLPGETFGVEDGCALRVSYGALGRDTVVEGVGRLVRGLEVLLGG
jgi:aspartate/methionine/tyrosine aminotransferase